MVKEVIPTKVHGVVDYATSGALLAAPELFRLKDVPSSARAPRIAGAAATAYSALTDYELGVVKALPMKAHLVLDAASGAALAASPWVLGYRRHGVRHWLPHTLVGLSEVAVALTSRSDSNAGGRRLGKKALVALAVAAPVAGGVIAWRKLAGNGSNGSDGSELYTSDVMASAGEPSAPVESAEAPEPAQAS
jgi:hypothetical protein